MDYKELFQIAVSQLEPFTNLINPDFRLEQIEHNKKEKLWEVIVSFLVENTNKRIGTIAGLATNFQYARKYKKVKINENKEVLGIYIYNTK